MIKCKGKELTVTLAKTGKSVAEIAREAGVSKNVIYRMRKGYLVRADLVGRVFNVIGKEMDEYIEEIDV